VSGTLTPFASLRSADYAEHTEPTISLMDLVAVPQWVAWRSEDRAERGFTKVPYCAPGKEAESNNPATWLTHDNAARIGQSIANGTGGGVGIMLGQCGRLWLFGVDLDCCRDPQSGEIGAWASEVIDRFASYTEISPSETGAKVFGLIDPADIEKLRGLMGGPQHGRQFKRANGAKHPPAIELYISHRFFTVTWCELPDHPQLRTVSLDDLRWLIETAGPALQGKPDRKQEQTAGHNNASILDRLNIASRHNKLVAAAVRDAATMQGGSRSEGAFRLGSALKRAGWSYADMKQCLLTCPATRDWATEKQGEGERQFARIWNRSTDNDTAGGQQGSSGNADPPPQIDSITLAPIGAANLPPRPWAYGKFLLFGTAAVIGAVDGGGKGAIAVVMAIAMITGNPLLGERVWRTGPVVIITYEDDNIEWHRRLAAACTHYQCDYEKVMANIHFLQKSEGLVSFAIRDGDTVIHPDSKAISEALYKIKPVLVVVDPFNHAHSLDDGNNNVMVAKVAAEVTRIVAKVTAAGLVLHHLRKGSTGSPDDLMGATSLRATFRSCRILARMTPEVAEKLEITDHWRYTRIAGSKENFTPPPEKSMWFKLVGVPLNNGTPEYPDGDDVAVATTWQPRPIFEGMDRSTLAAVFDELRRNVYGPNKQAKNTPWAGKVLIQFGARAELEATKIITAWLGSGVLTKGEYYHAESKNKVNRIVLDDAKAKEILRELEVADAPAE
jgi:hypothetical protein